MKKNIINKKIKAFTIVETLMTLLAITIMLTAPLTFMVRSYNYSQLIKYKIVVTGLAQEGLELATSLRNDDLTNFQATADACVNGCFADWDGVSSKPTFVPCTESDGGCVLYSKNNDPTILFRGSSVGDTKTDFSRSVKFTPIGTDGYVVESHAFGNVENIKIDITLKKMIFNLVIK